MSLLPGLSVKFRAAFEEGVLRSVPSKPLLDVSALSVPIEPGKAELADEETKTTDFEGFVSANERGLRQSLTAALGPEIGREAAAEALAYGWENWDRVEGLDNPGGYLYRVGLNWGRKTFGRDRVGFPLAPVAGPDWYEPGLADALTGLSEKQRVVVFLVHGHGWSMSEVADILGISKGTVQKHLERGMARLRRQLKVRHEH